MLIEERERAARSIAASGFIYAADLQIINNDRKKKNMVVNVLAQRGTCNSHRH